MRSKTEIKHVIKKHLAELHRDYAVSEIGIFGSYVRDEQTPKSDLDVLVQFSKPVGFISFMQLEQQLQQLLGLKVDLVTRDALKPNIGARILKEVDYVQ
ncbi:MAG: nucleotidyltransferase family protein [Desulfuromonas sp.]|nr:nucleotidyltransferase family protein [Desulfuromonas sp.]